MIKSMTGFGRSEVSNADKKITIEMKSVNHRYFEPGIKMPKKLNVYEAGIRTILKKYINRGKVDVFITYEDFSENNFCLKFNEDLANEYLSIFKYMSEKFDIDNDIKVSSLSRYPEVITMEEQESDEEELWKLLEKGVEEACRQFVESRIIEGVRLRSHIENTKDTLLEGGSIGRKLDFIAQEMNREANTILSKANDLEVSNWGISLKTEIEKVREQIQNIE